MLDADFLTQTFDAALPYAEYVATGTPDQQSAWADIYAQADLTDDQRKVIGGFTREMNILVSSGVWCGDCVQQCPLIQRIAEANPDRVHLRFVDRDEHADFAERIKICGGTRVPMAVLTAEDFEFCALAGDRTLTRYRAMAERQLGPACPLPGAPVPTEELRATLADWLNEIERVQLLLRLSTRLRQKHGD
ncbi:MAG: thiol reductase thioredoxin [Planctomycetota bacterium]|nr:MAG: thiol reductase thioredoxin [Planctomycetota bacterium]